MTLRSQGLAPVVAAWVFWCVSPSTAHAQCPEPSARIVHIDRLVEYKAVSAKMFVPASVNRDVCRGDSIRTGERSRATIVFVDNTRLVIDQNTEWVVREPVVPGRTLIDLIKGAILFLTRQPRSLDVHTPFVNAAVEGTEFLVRVGEDRTLITVFEGRVAAANPSGSLILTQNESAVALRGQAPQRQIIIRPRDAVQWALYYQPILPADSFERLDQIPEAQRDADFYVRRAGLLLGVGRLDEARADLEQALDRDPNDGDAYALRAIIAVALNDRAEALANGREAVKRSPKSAAARIALSYAVQANFELEAARDELLQAVADQPDDARAWARLAELWLSLGYLDRAREAAERAASLAPAEARANTVLGFVALARVDIAGATTAFERAIALESGNPLARLGLGLAKIRKGRLADGRREIEIAVALNPDDPIVRSYLGKAYFEEKREPLPGPQFERAKQIDPLDPTPWFYDAIRKQTLNRPVEALQDLEKAIDLNDNRAVYRSRFLLDQDLAVRSASLGRLYRDLGFEQLAQVEGWKSLDADPGDYSGHRLLADTYSALPRHEVARVSELLQSQLLQPINITPVPPHLAETDLFILERAGPNEPGFNEFNPMFDRNRVAGQFNGVAGNRSVLGDEATVSGIWNKVSFSVGQFHYDTDGFRENNGQDRDIFNAFVQAQLSSRTSVQAEVRNDDFVAGDLTLLLDPLQFSADQREHQESTVTRFGLRHVFTPKAQLIASVYFGNQDDVLSSSLPPLFSGARPGSLSISANADSWTAEVRYLLRAGRWSLTSGFGQFQSDRQRDITTVFRFDDTESVVAEQFSDDPRQTNVYLYSHIGLPSRVTLTLGGSADFYKSTLLTRNQFNPKVGLSWDVAPSTTVRIAAFRTLHRADVSSQTIEPTEVSGFNQFFADVEGEAAFRYGLAVDQKFSKRLFGGAEFSWRDLKFPLTLVDNNSVILELFPRHERLGRAYGYWTPLETLAVSVEYVYEQFHRTVESAGTENILELRTHRIPLGVRYFSPTGWSATATATYIHQRGTSADIAHFTGEDQFWVVDAAIGYRLPKRYGRLAFQVKNLFDNEFTFQDTDPGNPTVKPGRLALLTLSVGI
jgi:tetratricopeptide (TPR) repeat protein